MDLAWVFLRGVHLPVYRVAELKGDLRRATVGLVSVLFALQKRAYIDCNP